MAKIEQYNYQTEAAGPVEGQRETAETTGYVGKAIETLGDTGTAANSMIMQRKAQAEVSDVAAKAARTMGDLTVALRKGAQNPGDNPQEFAQNFLQNAQDQISDIGSDASTRQGHNLATKLQARIQQHIEIQANSLQANINGAQAGNNFTATANGLTDQAFNDPSVASMEAAKDAGAMSIDAIAEQYGVNEKQKQQWLTDLSKKITTAAVKGAINQDPDEALNRLNSGVYDADINGLDKASLVNEANAAIKARDVTADHIDKTADRAKKQADEAYFKQATLNFDNWTDSDTKKAQQTLPPTGPNSFRQLMDVLKNSKEQSDPVTVNDVTRRIALPDGDPNQINTASQIREFQASGKLNITDANRMAAQLDKGTDAKLRNTLLSTLTKQATAQLMPMGLNRLDAKGNQMLAGVLANIHAQLDGKPSGAQIKMLTPNDPSYIGDTLKTLHRDPVQDAKEQFAASKAAASQPQPVERMVKKDGKDVSALFDPQTKKFLRYK